jgi:hypothetical protein
MLPGVTSRGAASPILRTRAVPHSLISQRGQSFTARRFDPEAEAQDYSALLGEYYSEELDVAYRLSESEGRLMLETLRDRRTRVFVLEDGRVRTPIRSAGAEARGGRRGRRLHGRRGPRSWRPLRAQPRAVTKRGRSSARIASRDGPVVSWWYEAEDVSFPFQRHPREAGSVCRL